MLPEGEGETLAERDYIKVTFDAACDQEEDLLHHELGLVPWEGDRVTPGLALLSHVECNAERVGTVTASSRGAWVGLDTVMPIRASLVTVAPT